MHLAFSTCLWRLEGKGADCQTISCAIPLCMHGFRAARARGLTMINMSNSTLPTRAATTRN